MTHGSPDWTSLTLFVSLVAVGDSVSEDEVVCEIETDKVRHMFCCF